MSAVGGAFKVGSDIGYAISSSDHQTVRHSNDSSNSAMIGGIIGGCVALFLIIILSICVKHGCDWCCCCCYSDCEDVSPKKAECRVAKLSKDMRQLDKQQRSSVEWRNSNPTFEV